MDYLHSLTLKYDIIFVQGLWLLPTELYLLHNVNDDFNVFAISSMDEKVEQGLPTGGPFGGVAVSVKKHLCNLVTFCGCDNYGRIASTKLACQKFQLLFFDCHFPCNDHSSTYRRSLCDILGYIEAVAVSHLGVRLCILGDLNFECKSSNQGYLLFNNLANVHNVVLCDDLIDGEVYISS